MTTPLRSLAGKSASMDRTATAAALGAVVTSIGLNLPAAILMQQFAFPAILRRPPVEALTLFARNASTVIPAYYVFALASLSLIPLALLARRLQTTESTSILPDLAAVLGILTGLTQALGFLRWPFMEPALVQLYFAPDATMATRDAVLVVHEALNRYAGVAIGEHLGWLLHGTWMIALGASAVRRPTVWVPRVVGGVALSCGLFTLLSSVEQFGLDTPLVSISFYLGYVSWTLLLLPWAGLLWMRSRRRES
ncbi:hypothetical protein [Gemmatimonas groenlandica]|uniref:DUF4386 domain-containing protein n=1 Tax=Gemmatimonas groenlandica TaxID=2732249 RepID=A0A6M4IQY3_9BACT|nr:hypothetical protein [Gemmatimonas groenlandica]QJR36408.1 hypothetical protein HKW67_13285 [Gemmatimonas groenlandica]